MELGIAGPSAANIAAMLAFLAEKGWMPSHSIRVQFDRHLLSFRNADIRAITFPWNPTPANEEVGGTPSGRSMSHRHLTQMRP